MFGDVVKMASEGCSSTRLRILGKRHDKGRALHETSKKKKKKRCDFPVVLLTSRLKSIEL